MEPNIDTLNFLKEKVKELIKEYEVAEKEQKNREVIINSMKTTIQAISNPDSLSVESANGIPALEQKIFSYPEGATWPEKIIHFIKFSNRAVTSAEVVNEISKIEKDHTKKQIANLVSGNISSLVKDGKLKTYKPRKMKGFYYANPAWFEEDDLTGSIELKEEHKPVTKETSIW